MPELPEVEAVRRMLERATRGARIARVELRRPDLRRPFPADFVARLTGHTIQSISRRGKYLLAALSSGETLLVHLGMSGAFRAEQTASPRPVRPRAADPHDHVVIVLSSGVVVTFNDPRRFGLMDLIRANEEHDSASRDGTGAAGRCLRCDRCWRARAQGSAWR